MAECIERWSLLALDWLCKLSKQTCWFPCTLLLLFRGRKEHRPDCGGGRNILPTRRERNAPDLIDYQVCLASTVSIQPSSVSWYTFIPVKNLYNSTISIHSLSMMQSTWWAKLVQVIRRPCWRCSNSSSQKIGNRGFSILVCRGADLQNLKEKWCNFENYSYSSASESYFDTCEISHLQFLFLIISHRNAAVADSGLYACGIFGRDWWWDVRIAMLTNNRTDLESA